jgi:hypothetical protein
MGAAPGIAGEMMLPFRGLTLHGKVDSLEGASLSQGVQNVKDEENEKTVHGRV